MDISFWLVIIGTLGLLTLFSFKLWQMKTNRDFTSYLSRSLEKGVTKGARYTKGKAKDHFQRAKEKALNGSGKLELKKRISNNRMLDLIKGKKTLNYNGNSSSEFLNNMSEVKKVDKDN